MPQSGALAKLRRHKREERLAATERNLDKIKARTDAGKLAGQDEIGLRVSTIIIQYKMAKHFELAIGDTTFSFARKLDGIKVEAALDWHLHHPHFGERCTDGCSPVRAQLQVAGQR
jgi:hypothetical protein